MGIESMDVDSGPVGLNPQQKSTLEAYKGQIAVAGRQTLQKEFISLQVKLYEMQRSGIVNPGIKVLVNSKLEVVKAATGNRPGSGDQSRPSPKLDKFTKPSAVNYHNERKIYHSLGIEDKRKIDDYMRLIRGMGEVSFIDEEPIAQQRSRDANGVGVEGARLEAYLAEKEAWLTKRKREAIGHETKATQKAKSLKISPYGF